MADENINKLGIRELLEKEKLTDDDIIIVEDTENTKKVSFRNLRDSLIDDNELPSSHRIYSSYKLDAAIQDFQQQIDHSIGSIEGDISTLKENSITPAQVDKKIDDFSKKVPGLADVDSIKQGLENKRSVTDPITCDDIESGDNSKKIQPKNLSYEVISMMVGTTPVTAPAVPEGGWVQEDIAKGAIVADKLSKQYRFRGRVQEGSIDKLTQDGIYLLSTSIEGVPKFDANEQDQERLLEVYNFGPNQNIMQKVYYIQETDTLARPTYVRKAPLSRLYLTEFIAEYPVTDKYKLQRKVLVDNFLNYGAITSGSVYDLTADGDYFVKKGVKDLPKSGYDFTVTVRKFDTRIEYTARSITALSCEIYISSSYVIESSGMRLKTDWYQTNSVSKSRLDGKRLHLYGDGVCYGLGSSNIPLYSFPALLSSRYGIIIQNHALGDATIGVYGDDYLAERSVIKQIENSSISDKDMAIIFAGSNDYKSGVAKIGSNTDETDTSFKGAMNLCIKKLIEKNPTVRILVITPLFRARLDADNFRNSDETPINELLLSDYATAMKNISDYNHIPCLDLHSSGMINKYNFSSFLSDRLYLNDNGHDMLADKIFSALDFYY